MLTKPGHDCQKTGFARENTPIRFTSMTLQPDLFGAGREEETAVLFLDTETTGADPDTAEICEVALMLTRYRGFERIGETPLVFTSLVKPSSPIPPEASAVHHISNLMVGSSPPVGELRTAIEELASGAAYVCAHNLPYDMAILRRQVPSAFGRFSAGHELDTLRLSRHVWPEIPSHALQALRYRFDLDAGIEGAPHRALFDTELVRSLLESVIEGNLTGCGDWTQLADFIRSPLEVLVFTFGKYRGSLVEDVVAQDGEYVSWLLRQPWIPAEYPDLYHTLLRKTGKGPGKDKK
jgi:exodeoxyribonuclease X